MRNLALPLLFLIIPSISLAETPWERYVLLPSPENAGLVSRIEYSDPEQDRFDYQYRHILLLQLQIAAGDAEAFRLAYRLRETADGALLEYVDLLMATMIRPHPEIFLTEISGMSLSDYALKSVLLMTGETYVDLYEAQQYERQSRYEAIQNVEKESLLELRDKCLNILRAAD